MYATATFVFAEFNAPRLPRVLDLLMGMLRADDAVHGEVTLETEARLVFVTDGLTLNLSRTEQPHQSAVTLSLKLRDRRAAPKRLAALTFGLLQATEALSVIWLDTSVAIPRSIFLRDLEDCLAAKPITPRRPALALRHRRPPSRRIRHSDKRYDSHVAAFEAHLRHALCRSASSDELAACAQSLPILARARVAITHLLVAPLAKGSLA
ncbi:hypothetical protein [Sagittula sp. SSi028]|uniref:hypothetical protein n=1 Tax=Sagittula sp. SSi028 TaxID=3400636 RepID=UPI003AF93CFA